LPDAVGTATDYHDAFLPGGYAWRFPLRVV